MHLQALLFGPTGAVSKSSHFPLIYLKVRAFTFSLCHLSPSLLLTGYLSWQFKSILCLKVDSACNAPGVSFTPE